MWAGREVSKEAPALEFPKGTPGRNRPDVNLNVETIISTPGQPPPNDVDVLDDDY
jgi:hypothetical protein